MKSTTPSSIRSIPKGFAWTSTLGVLGGLAVHASAQAPASAVPTAEPVVITADADKSFKPEAISTPKFTQPLRDIPQTISVVPQTVIESRGATNLSDVLRNVPGISMQAGEGGGGLPGDNLSIRGFNARTDMFIDGVRDYGSYSRDPYNFEQVEVAKGPSSSTSGRGSTGGSINLVTKTPKADSFYRSDLTGGTDNLFRGTLDINVPLWSEAVSTPNEPAGKGPIGKAPVGKGPVGKGPVNESTTVNETRAAFRLNGMYHTNDVPGRDNVENERWAVAPSLAFGLGTDTRLTLTYSHMEEDNVPDYGVPWIPLNTNPRLARYSNQAGPASFENWYGLNGYDFEKTETDVVGVSFEHDFSDAVKLRNFSRYSRSTRDSAITAPRFNSIETTTLLNRQLQRRQMENEIWANQTDLTIKFATGALDHTVVTGIELSRENQDNVNSAQATNQPLADYFHPNAGQKAFGPMPGITGTPNSAQSDTFSAYLFDTVKIGKQWEITGGARYDRVETDYDTYPQSANPPVIPAPGVPTSFNRTDDMLSWRAALVFKPIETGSIYFGYGTSFNPSVDGNVGLALTPQNAELKPEETGTFELGTKWDLLEERLSLSAAVFSTEKTNARTVDPTDPAAITVLDGEQRVQGFELGATGQITDWWSVYAGYTYLDSEVRESRNPLEVGNELSNTPENSLSLWTTFKLPGNIEIGGGAQFVDNRFNTNTSLNRREAPSYWTFDAMASYKITDNFSIRLNVYNLADEEYIDRVGGGHFVPGAGRSASLTASISF